MLRDLKSKKQRKDEKITGELERKRKNETQDESGARTGRGRKGEEDYYCRKYHQAGSN
jgi:hypothetical protein